jgi:hypothetical protein
MTSLEVKNRIEQEIGCKWEHSNAHGVDLRTCLVHPERQRFLDCADEGRAVDLWLVLEEDPKTRRGYKIVFDEDNGMCGLSIADQNGRAVFLGYYGDFITTLDAM